MRVVVALGGNALLRRGQPMTIENQRENVGVACDHLAPIARQHELVISHGNGPQIGLLALEEAAYETTPDVPLDVLGAETQGMIGYLVEQELGNRLPFEQPLATLLTMIEVDPRRPGVRGPDQADRPALHRRRRPTQLAAERGWAFKPDGDSLRRVVPSPRPEADLRAPPDPLAARARLRRDLRRRWRHPDRLRRRTAARRRRGRDRQGPRQRPARARLDADMFDHGDRRAGGVRRLRHDRPARDRRGAPRRAPRRARGEFAAGSMLPKVIAACDFARATGKPAVIGALADIEAMLAGTAGTRISTDVDGVSSLRRRPEQREETDMAFGVHSEVGKLRKVMVHRPGPRAHPPHPVERRGAAVRRRAVGDAGQARARHVLRGDARARASRCSRPRRCSPRRWRSPRRRTGSASTSSTSARSASPRRSARGEWVDDGRRRRRSPTS